MSYARGQIFRRTGAKFGRILRPLTEALLTLVASTDDFTGSKRKKRALVETLLIMPLTIWNCVLSFQQKNNRRTIGMFFHEITFITEFPGSNILLPTV